MPRYIHDDPDRVYACPECDGAGEVYHRTHESKDFDHDFRCHKCGSEFDTPVERAAKPKAIGNGTGGGAVEDDDGLPASLDPDAKELIRQARGP